MNTKHLKTRHLITPLMALMGAATAAEPDTSATANPSHGFARAPEDALVIERAPAPLYRDPILDGVADPSVVYHEPDGSWLIYYTQRRANIPVPGVAWAFGGKIGIARSTDKGRSWLYAGTAKGIACGSELDTFWAPHVFKDGELFHMFVTYIETIPDRFGGGNPTIRHYTSVDGLDWKFSDVVDTGSDDIIDAAVVKLPDQRWLLVFRDCNAGSRTAMCVSTDLKKWERLPQAVGEHRHEAPVIFSWKDRYWMLIDEWEGLGAYVSKDGLSYERNGRILKEPGRRPDDGVRASHPGVAVVGDRAFVFYHTHPDQRPGVEQWETTNTHTYQYKRSSLQIAELKVSDGKLVCDRNEHAR